MIKQKSRKKFKNKKHKLFKVGKNKQIKTNILNPVYSLKLTTREILKPDSIKKLNFQPI